MNQDAINSDLRERTSTESLLQQKIMREVKAYIKASSDYMSRYWDVWEMNDKIYRGYRIPDKDDKDANVKNEPIKVIVPVAYAQIQTAVSFILGTFAQRDHFFELTGMGPEDEKYAFALEHDLHYQMVNQKMLFKLYCWLVDTFKLGFGVVKNDWVHERARVRTQKQVPVLNLLSKLGLKSPTYKTEEILTDVVSYEGNRVTNISPYCFYPDPDVPLFKFQEGAFVATEDEVNLTFLKGLEGDLYHGTLHIPTEWSKADIDYRKRRIGSNLFSNKELGLVKAKDIRQVILTEITFNIVPATWTTELGIDLGDETYPVKFVCAIGNDRKIIRFEPAGYLHNKFNYSIFEYSPDQNNFFNPGLVDTVGELQGLVNWFFNSHVIAVRKMIKTKMVVDPESVHLADINSDDPYIRLKGTGTKNVDRVIKQLQTYDPTSNHVKDVDTINTLIQLVTGINDNALGQYSTGRRSATEARSVNAGAAARLKMHAQLCWYMGIEPLGRQIISNTRQGRSRDVYEQIVGTMSQDAPYEKTILADPIKIAGCYDFVPYDATLPTDKDRQAGVLTNLFEAVAGNPQLVQAMNINMNSLMKHILDLNGIRNMSDFQNQQAGGQGLPPMQAQVVPNEVAAQAAQNGAQPVDPFGNNLAQQLANG